ncbi:MAG TPA: hypothetical protein VK421_06160 [Pyrinomonadaceae bacterium]|nr:hypothetical protein [Pyrinomonadaceae bacterium]
MSQDLSENCNRLRIVLDEIDAQAMKHIAALENVLRETARERERLELVEERAREREAPKSRKGR